MDKQEFETSMFAHTARYSALMERRRSIQEARDTDMKILIPDELRTKIEATENVYKAALGPIDEDLNTTAESIRRLVSEFVTRPEMERLVNDVLASCSCNGIIGDHFVDRPFRQQTNTKGENE